MLKTLSVVFIGGAVLMASGCVTSQTVRTSSHHQVSSNTQVTVVFSNSDRSNINRYYVNQYRTVRRAPPKHRKDHDRRFKRHYVVPNQLHYTRLPSDLERHLSPLPRDYIRIRIGDEIGIMNTRTRIIYDSMWFIN